MKKAILVSLATTALAIVVLGDSTRPSIRRRRPTRPSAGILERKEAIPSRQIDVRNYQKKMDENSVARAIKASRLHSSLPLCLGETKSPARIEIVEDDNEPGITIFPDIFMAKVNVNYILSDKPTPSVLVKRLETQLARAALFIMGSGSVSYKGITMPVRTLADLDSLSKVYPSPQEIMHLNAGKRLGIRTLTFCTYDMACREGWAPAPTNEIQKAIWDEIHAIPTNPMKIKYQPKK